MIGMSLLSFLILSAIAVLVAVIFQYVLHYGFLEGTESLIGKIAVGWLGGWLGPPILGHWLFQIGEIYVVPALLGSAAGIFLSVAALKALAKACGGRTGP